MGGERGSGGLKGKVTKESTRGAVGERRVRGDDKGSGEREGGKGRQRRQ